MIRCGVEGGFGWSGCCCVCEAEFWEVSVEGDMLAVLCRESPVKGRVNKELIKELSRIFKKRVEILAGLTSREKKMLIKDISKDETYVILSRYVSR